MNTLLTRASFVALFLLLTIGAASGAAYDDFLNAVKTSDVRVATQLLRRGIDPNTVDPTGQPALHLAAREGSLDIVKLLADARADLDKRNSTNESAIMLAALAGHRTVVEFLLSREAQINHPGWTPIIYAASNGHTDIIKVLIENHAYIDSSSTNGLTSLMMASRGGHLQAVKLLLDEDADANLKNDRGETALDWALRAKNTDIAALLREKMKKK